MDSTYLPVDLADESPARQPEPEKEAPPRQTWQARVAGPLPPFVWRARLGVALVAVLAVGCVSSWLGTRQRRLRSNLQSPLEVKDQTRCGAEEPNILYRTYASVGRVHGVSSSEKCGLECRGEPKCGAWTWSGEEGRVCTLQALKRAEKPTRVEKHGVVSGLVCQEEGRDADEGRERHEGGEGGDASPEGRTERSESKLKSERAEEPEEEDVMLDQEPVESMREEQPDEADASEDRLEEETELDEHEESEREPEEDAEEEKAEEQEEAEEETAEEQEEAEEEKAEAEEEAGEDEADADEELREESAEKDDESEGDEEDEENDEDDDLGKVDPDKCDLIEDGIDIETKSELYEIQHIVDEYTCRRKCEETMKCGAWSWGKEQHIQGLSNVCFLKRLGKHETPRRKKKHGVVSGLPRRGDCRSRSDGTSYEASQDDSDCGHLEEGIDYWTGVPLYSIDSVVSSEDCQMKCGWDTDCGAWTWGKAYGVKGLTHVCFLKGLKKGESPTRSKKEGVVSGLPCRSRAVRESATDVEHKLEPLSKKELAKLKSCRKTTEHGIDYRTDKSLYHVENVHNYVQCRFACEGEPKCGAWTWGKVGHIVGLTHVCFLKVLKKDDLPDRYKNPGVMSGFPCKKKAHHSSEPMATTSEEEEDLAPPSRPPPQGKTNCGSIENNTDYWTPKSLKKIMNTATAEMCLMKCEAMKQCAAWSWGSQKGISGLSDVCFLKGAGKRHFSGPRQRVRHGVMSGLPCHTKISGRGSAEGSSTLFCFAVMVPGSYEERLLAMQKSEHASLFACEGYGIYSSRVIIIAPGLQTTVVDSDLQCKKGGEFGTALNTDIFMAVWSKVISDGNYAEQEWTVKVDPDTVFFAPKLREALMSHHEAPNGVYLNNCWRGLHGPFEVFSRNAVKAWAEGSKKCEEHFKKLCSGPCAWGEDMFIDQCLWKVLNVRRDNVFGLLSEAHCDPKQGWDKCEDVSRVAFHPFKTVAGYRDCLSNAESIATTKVL